VEPIAVVGVYGAVFLAGVAGSMHCVGMCGAFPLALAGTGGRPLARQLLYNAGRVNALLFIGAVSGAAGAGLVASGPVAAMERTLAIVAGALMAVLALEMLGVIGGLTARGATLARATVGRLLGGVIRSRSPAAPVALGVFNAFLPCQLVYAFAARAASTGSVGAGVLTMLAFGLGTVPAMLLVATLQPAASAVLRARLQVVSAVLLLAFAVLTVLRGVGGVALLHHHH